LGIEFAGKDENPLMAEKPYGTLFICATPIGNMEDITVRVIKTLKSVDLIAAEDTRQALKICNRYHIRSPLTSYHEHNEKKRSKLLLEQLKSGKSIALVSNAGTPGLSDPGYRLIKACIEEGVAVEILPGPAAAIAALVVSGLATDKFVFEGFLPRRKGERGRALQRLVSESRTVILYESPHRILSLLQEMEELFEGRKVALVRELTKKFEEVVRGTPTEILSHFKSKAPRGELVIVIEGSREKREYSDEFIRARLESLMTEGLSKRDAIAKVATETGVARRIIYEKVRS
jgi:16S rRNA (cytidine1402-2'-O)-methyltransferase